MNGNGIPDANPYAPPTTECESTSARGKSGSPAFSAISTIAGLAFIAFTIVLLRSNSTDDRYAGLLFLANTPVLAGLSISAFSSRRVSSYFGLAAATVQIAVTVVMLAMSIGDPLIVIGINATIVLSCLGIGLWAWRANRTGLLSHSLPADGG